MQAASSRMRSAPGAGAPMSWCWGCRAAACRSGNRDWDDRTRSLRLGSDPVVVRLSTVNGPVTASER